MSKQQVHRHSTNQHSPRVGETFTLENAVQVIDHHRSTCQGEVDRFYRSCQDELIDDLLAELGDDVIDELNRQGIIEELYRELDWSNPVEFQERVIDKLNEQDPEWFVGREVRRVEDQDPEQVKEERVRELENLDPEQARRECISYLSYKDPEQVKVERLRELENQASRQVKNRYLRELRGWNPKLVKVWYLDYLRSLDPEQVKQERIKELLFKEDLRKVKRWHPKELEENPRLIKKWWNTLKLWRLHVISPKQIKDEYVKELEDLDSVEVREECLNYLDSLDSERVKEIYLDYLRNLDSEQGRQEYVRELKNQQSEQVKLERVKYLENQDPKEGKKQRINEIESEDSKKLKKKDLFKINNTDPEQVMNEFFVELNGYEAEDVDDLINISIKRFIGIAKQVLTKQDSNKLTLDKLLSMEFIEGIIWMVAGWEDEWSLIELVNSTNLGSTNNSTLNLHKVMWMYVRRLRETNNPGLSTQLLQLFNRLENFHHLLMANSCNRVNQVTMKDNVIVDTYMVMGHYHEFLSEQLNPLSNLLRWCRGKLGKTLVEKDVEYLGEVQLVEHVEVEDPKVEDYKEVKDHPKAKVETERHSQQPQPLSDDLTLGQVIGWIKGKFSDGLSLLSQQVMIEFIKQIILFFRSSWLFYY